jgi:hypothetical protein
MNVFTRWVIIYSHDRSPVDNGTFTHKPAALKALDGLPNKNKLAVTRMAMQEVIA